MNKNKLNKMEILIDKIEELINQECFITYEKDIITPPKARLQLIKLITEYISQDKEVKQ